MLRVPVPSRASRVPAESSRAQMGNVVVPSRKGLSQTLTWCGGASLWNGWSGHWKGLLLEAGSPHPGGCPRNEWTWHSVPRCADEVGSSLGLDSMILASWPASVTLAFCAAHAVARGGLSGEVVPASLLGAVKGLCSIPVPVLGEEIWSQMSWPRASFLFCTSVSLDLCVVCCLSFPNKRGPFCAFCVFILQRSSQPCNKFPGMFLSSRSSKP